METLLLPVHLTILAYLAYTIFRADHLGLKWMQGKIQVLNEKIVRSYHYRTLTGLILMIVTGFLLFWPMHEYLLTRWEFYVKMFFVITLVINAFVINNLTRTATTRKFSELTQAQKIPLFLSGAVSSIAWLATFAMAFFINEF